MTWKRVGFIAGTVSLLAVVLFVRRGALSGVFESRYQARLAGAFAPQRLTEARLTGFGWAPFEGAHRGVEAAALVRLSDAVTDIANGIGNDRSVEARRMLGLVSLAKGDVGVAADGLEQLAREERHDPTLWSDAAAARLEQARRSGDVRFALDALTLADRATRLDSGSAAARFNRALALEKLGLTRSAGAEYQRAIANDDGGAWAREAKKRAQALGGATTAMLWSEAKAVVAAAARRSDEATVIGVALQFPQQARTWAEGECLASWSDAVRNGCADDAESNLAIARSVGRALKAYSGEALLDDAVAAIDRARAQGGGRSVRSLVDAYDVYRRGRIALSQRNDNAAAASSLHQAADRFREGGSPMADVARYFEATARFEAGDASSALAALRDLAARAPAGYLALHAQIDWEIGTVMAVGGDVYNGLEAYTRACATFERLHEDEFATRLRILRAGKLHLLGDAGEAWHVRRDAFLAASRSGNADLLELVLGESATNEIGERHWDGARALADVAIHDVPPQNLRRRFDTILRRALITQPVDLHDARVALAQIRDPALRSDAENDLRLARALSIRGRQPERAAELLSGCIAYETGKREFKLPGLYMERARAYRRIGRTDAALRDLNESMTLFERYRRSIERHDLRDSFIGTVDDAFDELLDLHAAAGQYDAVVALGERRRGRLLLDTFGESGTAAPLLPQEIADRVVNGEQLLLLTAAGDRVVASSITHGVVSTRALPQSRRDLAAKAQALRDALEKKDDGSADRIAESLYEDLIAPFGQALRQGGILVIVADPPLRDFPFAMLRRSGRYLVETATVLRAASGSAYVQSPAAPEADRSSVVAVGDPSFDARAFPRLPDLPDAADEAAEISRMYPHAQTLVRTAATFQRLAEAAPGAGVIHIAAHAIVNPNDVSQSQMLFAADGGGNGTSSIRRLSTLPLKRGCMVVLAGCETGVGDATHGDLRDFAGAFLAAGASSAVSTLWNVEDSTARRFAVWLHEDLRRGAEPASAVRSAQLRMLRSEDPALRSPRAWSAFQLYGSGK